MQQENKIPIPPEGSDPMGVAEVQTSESQPVIHQPEPALPHIVEEGVDRLRLTPSQFLIARKVRVEHRDGFLADIKRYGAIRLTKNEWEVLYNRYLTRRVP